MKNQLRPAIHFFVKSYPISALKDNDLGDNIINPNIAAPEFCAIQKYESTIKIKEIMDRKNLSFSFKCIDRKKIFNELQKLKCKNSCQGSDIRVKIIKENIDIITGYIYNSFNKSQFSSYFPSNLKYTDKKPVFFKEKDCKNVEKY